MKNLLVTFLFLSSFALMNAQQLKPIRLNEPNKKRGLPVMQALEQRKSVREYADKNVSLQDLSDLLWAANGINRPETGHRTAPSAMNKQDIRLYVITKEGAYQYEPAKQSLKPVATGDLRPLVASSQDFVKQAPVCIVLVSDGSSFNGGDTETNLMMRAADAGIVSQNISIFCAGNGLATVPRAYMENEQLKKALNLTATERPILNHPVGYPKQ